MSLRLFICLQCPVRSVDRKPPGGFQRLPGWRPLGNAGVGHVSWHGDRLALGCVDALWVIFTISRPCRIVTVLACIYVVGTIGGCSAALPDRSCSTGTTAGLYLSLAGASPAYRSTFAGVFDFLSAGCDENLPAARVSRARRRNATSGLLSQLLTNGQAARWPPSSGQGGWSPSFVGFVVCWAFASA